ncbi:MAG TPA: TonB-dependent receptor, partial [Blastocatellia bacterium]|nr:TonB-dependent receptor [Blastocatellia bacterium]
FKIEVNSPSAEFGRFNGGVVNLTTKSGTNDFHRTVFEFLRNEALNARNFFTPITAANPRFRRNQYGLVAGGPIAKDKTFFFVDYQGTRQLVGRIRTSTVPTLAERKGDFSSFLGAKLCLVPAGAATTDCSGANTPLMETDTNGQTIQAQLGMITRQSDRRVWAGNIIPPGQFDSVAAALLARYPLPTSGGNANNFTRIGNEPDNQDQFDVRIDHKISSKDQIFGRYSFALDITNPVAPLPDGSGTISTGTIAPTRTLGQGLASSYIHTFSDRALNEFRFGYTRRSVLRTDLLLGNPASQAINLPGIPRNAAFNSELPTFSVSGFQQLGPAANTDSIFKTDVTEFVDSISMLRGRHSLKFGLDYRWERLDVIQPPSPTGIFSFSTLFSDIIGPKGSIAGTGNPLASFLQGQVQAFSIDLQQKELRPRAHIQEYFIQDDWKVSPRFTVNAGLRYTLNFPSTDAGNQGAVFNLQTQQLQFLGQNGFPDSARKLHKDDFGPRLGLAFRINDKTVLRSGYGLVWIEQAGITTPFTIPQFPFLQTVGQRTLDSINPAFVLANGPTVAPIPLTPNAGLGQGVFSVDRDLSSGYVQQWNLGVQRELAGNLVVEVAYAGSRITHVGLPDVNINQLTADQLALGSQLLVKVPNPFFGIIPRSSSLGDPMIPAAQLLKPFPEFTTVSLYRNNVGNTFYHALQAKMEKRFSGGLSFLVSYTRSKLLDEASSVFDASILTGPIANFPVADSFRRILERDVSTGDMPNVFVTSFTYDLPFGAGQRFLSEGILGKITEGWELAGAVTAESGLPLAVTQATNFNAFAGFGTQRPDLVGDPNLVASQRTTTTFFNTAAFAVAPQFTIGTASRNPVRGPAYRDLDLAIIKRTRVKERYNLEFRAEVFNFTNTPPLGTPNVVLGTPGFGSITSAGDPRVIQMALKLNF